MQCMSIIFQINNQMLLLQLAIRVYCFMILHPFKLELCVLPKLRVMILLKSFDSIFVNSGFKWPQNLPNIWVNIAKSYQCSSNGIQYWPNCWRNNQTLRFILVKKCCKEIMHLKSCKELLWRNYFPFYEGILKRN